MSTGSSAETAVYKICSASEWREVSFLVKGGMAVLQTFGVIVCSCLSVRMCAWYTEESARVCVCGRHAYKVAGPAAHSRATVGPDSGIKDLEDTSALRFNLLNCFSMLSDVCTQRSAA